MWRYFKRIYQRFALESDRYITGKFEFGETSTLTTATPNESCATASLGEVRTRGAPHTSMFMFMLMLLPRATACALGRRFYQVVLRRCQLPRYATMMLRRSNRSVPPVHDLRAILIELTRMRVVLSRV